MAEPARRVIEQDTVLRNINDDDLVRMVQSDLTSTDLERHLAERLAHHHDMRRHGINVCSNCAGDDY